MNPRTLYLSYGLVILAIGLIGWLITHAKSALISGLATGGIMILISFFASGGIARIVAKVFNVLFLGAFAWRSTLAISALSAGDQAKFIPSVLLSLMAIASVVALAISILKPPVKEELGLDN